MNLKYRKIISEALSVGEESISELNVLKKGMTNRSYRFSCMGKPFILRVPGEGTDMLINRHQEAEVYRAISGKGLCDDPVYINEESGYKISRFLENIHVCDPNNEQDVNKSLRKLKELHSMKIVVDHSFDLFGQIEYYESLREGKPSCFEDYDTVKKNNLELRRIIKESAFDFCLTHIDAVPDNFIFDNESGRVQLTDWEYAGMQDPHLDIAMFCIYSNYGKQQIDEFIDRYFECECSNSIRRKIYCYISLAGLLWSNWCEYKERMGVIFGEYALNQYEYARTFSKIVLEG